MPSLEQTLAEDFIQALKSKDELKISTLRLLKSSLDKLKKAPKSSKDAVPAGRQESASAKEKSELNDEEIIRTIKQEVKKRQEAIESFKKGNREDLAEKEAAEMAVLKVYLPPELPEEEIKAVINKVISENNLTQADFGQAMKMVMEELGSQADGKIVAGLVKQTLGGEE